MAVAGNVGEEQSADSTGGTAGHIVDIAAALSLTERFAVDPDIEPSQFDTAGSKLAATPYFHALHLPLGGIGHAGIISAGEIIPA